MSWRLLERALVLLSIAAVAGTAVVNRTRWVAALRRIPWQKIEPRLPIAPRPEVQVAEGAIVRVWHDGGRARPGRVDLDGEYSVEVKLDDGARFRFSGLGNALERGSRVAVRLSPGKQGQAELLAGLPAADTKLHSIRLSRLQPTPVGDAGFSITFPGPPAQLQDRTATLFSWVDPGGAEPDRYVALRSPAEGDGSERYFERQTRRMLTLLGAGDVVISFTRRIRVAGGSAIQSGGTIFGGLCLQGQTRALYDPARNLMVVAAVLHCPESVRDPTAEQEFLSSLRLAR